VTAKLVLGKSMSIFPVFVVTPSSRLREAFWPVSDFLQVRECTEEGESSWKEPSGHHKSRKPREIGTVRQIGDAWQPSTPSGKVPIIKPSLGVWSIRIS
jgi:hypothetical protein